MNARSRRRRGVCLLVGLLSVAVAVAFAAMSLAALPDANDRITACVSRNGAVLVVQRQLGPGCQHGERSIRINPRGPAAPSRGTVRPDLRDLVRGSELGAVRHTASAAQWGSVRDQAGGPDIAQFAPCRTPGAVLIDGMTDPGAWVPMLGNGAVAARVGAITGCSGTAVELIYDLGSVRSGWAQIRRDFASPLDLSFGDHLRVFYTGTTPNTLEIGFSTPAGNAFATERPTVSQARPWTYATWDLRDFRIDATTPADLHHVMAIFMSAAFKSDGDAGGAGRLAIDQLELLDLSHRAVPPPASVPTRPNVARRAAAFIAGMQRSSGLLKSWREDPADLSYSYDQAVALLVLQQTYPSRARRVARALQRLQNRDGSWFTSYRVDPPSPANDHNKPIGANAWLIYALARYAAVSDDRLARRAAKHGATWLSGQQRSDGSLPGAASEPGAPTEANLDSWWAFSATGLRHARDHLRQYLLQRVWDPALGRFRAAADSYEIFLDNQTWGAPFLRAVGRERDARRALAYADLTLATTSHDRHITGLDGAGPFSVWNEGTAQYVVARGSGSATYLQQLIKQQAVNGGMPNSPDNFTGGGVWLTRWHGVAPTAWLYFATHGDPLHH